MTREDVLQDWLPIIKNMVTGRDVLEKAIDFAFDAVRAQTEGEWEEKEVTDYYPGSRIRYYCTACGDWNTYGKTQYCPDCGAKMKKENKDGWFN